MASNRSITAIGRQMKRAYALSRPIQLATLAIALVSGQASAALIITPSFDGTIATNFGGNAGAFTTAFTTAIAAFTNTYSDPIHVNINVTTVAGSGILGQSSTTIFGVGYAALRVAAVADAKSADDATSIGAGGSVAVADPGPGGSLFWATKAQRKALGMAADDLTVDGTITLGAGFTYDFDPSDGITPGAIDIVGVMMHEISEVMGRIGISGGIVGGFTSYTLLDAFAYTGAGVRGLNFVASDFFSINNGTTLLKQFNQIGGGDSRDWQSGTNDSFNAFSSSGVLNGFSAVDMRVMDVIGYDLAVPEPSTGILLVSALLAGGLIRRRATSQK